MPQTSKDLTDRGTMRLLSVVTPCYNESEVIRLFYDALRPVLESLPDLDFEIIFVDDGSSDDTLLLLNNIAENDLSVRVCSLSRNFGHQIALSAGLDFAVGDAVVLMDADLQHPPELIPDFVQKWEEGFDIVSAVRSNAQGSSWFKNVIASTRFSIFSALPPSRKGQEIFVC